MEMNEIKETGQPGESSADTKPCYQCDAQVDYLFSDARCWQCTGEELESV